MLRSGIARITTGPDLERSIVRTDLLTGAAAATWLIPISMLFNPVRHEVFVFVTVLAAAASMAMFLLGVVYRSQRTHIFREQEQRIAADNALREIKQLVLDLQLFCQAQAIEAAGRIDQVAARVERDRWNVYAEAAADQAGGEDVVSSTTTRALPNASVYRFPQHRSGRF